jgi:hypothetical protein
LREGANLASEVVVTRADQLARKTARPARRRDLPQLRSGDELSLDEYLERYEAMPEGTRAELIDGVVFMSAAALHAPHASFHAWLLGLLTNYALETPGCQPLIGPTLILGPKGAPEPDAALRLIPEAGGRSRLRREKILSGPIELVAEVADSSAAMDLGRKKKAYFKGGVHEYVVVVVQTNEVIWFVRGGRGYRRLRARDGISKSRVFPGLWLDTRALLAEDGRRLMAVLGEGLGSPEHRAFVRRLERRLA